MKSLKTLLFILFLGFQLSSAGQWRDIELPDSSRSSGWYEIEPYDVKLLPDGAISVFAYDNNLGDLVNLLTVDEGITWDTIIHGDARCYFYNKDIMYQRIWTSGVGDSWEKTINGGNTWSPITVNGEIIELLSDSSLMSLDNNYFYLSEDQAGTWDTIFWKNSGIPGSSLTIEDHQIVNKDSITLVVKSSGNYYLQKTYDGGSSWDTSSFNFSVSKQRYADFEIISDSVCFAYSYFGSFRTEDGGASWDTVSISNSRWIRDVTHFRNTVVLTCSSAVSPDSMVAISRDYGKTFLWSSFGYTPTYYSDAQQSNFFSADYGVVWYGGNDLSIYDNRCPANLISESFFCDSVSIDLSYYSSFDSILWSDGNTSLIRDISSSGTYSVILYLDSTCTISDTFTVIDLTDVALADTSFCEEGIVLVDTGFTSYLWSTGASGTQETISTSGDYTVTVTDVNGCSTSDSFRVDIYSLPTLSLLDTFICPGDTAVLDGGDFAAHIWSTGVITRTIKASLLGDYFVLVTDSNGCETTDTAKVSSYPQNILTIGSDTALCGDSIVLDVSSYKPVVRSYTWSTGDTTDLVVFDQSGAYWLEVTDTNGCYARDTVNLTLHPTPSAPVMQRVSDTLYTSSRLIHQWYQDGNLLVGQSDSTLPSIAVGTYSVIVLDSNGCESDTSNLVLYTAGVSALLADGGISAYPNPTNGGVVVRLKDISQNDIVRISVVSLQGQELDFTSVWEQDQLKLKWDIAPQPVWLVIQTTNGQYRKLLIER
jgi:hypothetical protein